MSYYSLTDQAYQPVSLVTAGGDRAPVPGWGINPLRAGAPMIAVGAGPDGLGDTPEERRAAARSKLLTNVLILGGALGVLVLLTPALDRLVDPYLGHPR